MTDMIERVARAISAMRNKTAEWDHDAAGFDADPPHFPWGKATNEARAVLEAMREPTFPMEQAGGERQHFSSHQWGNPKECWRAMIDAALKE